MSEENSEPIDIEVETEMIEGEEETTKCGIAVDDVLDWHSPERAAAKERIRLAFVSGKATLAYMARIEKVPYNTISQWSIKEKWGEAKAAVALKTSEELVENIADFVAKERVKQVKRALSRSDNIRSLVDEAAKNARQRVNADGSSGIMPSDVQALSTAEERADNITRRNLGMDQQSGGGNSLSVNILTNSITLS